MSPRHPFVYWLALPLGLCLGSQLARGEEVVFERDILPILSDKCFQCHGPDAATREADLRLDLAGAAVEQGVIVPGRPTESPLVERVTSADPDTLMPPPATNLSLTDKEKERLAKWIAEGAEYSTHWAFRPLPDEVAVPVVKQEAWPRKPIDHFVLAKLEEQQLSPSPRAEPLRLLRRVTLALTGLPPTPAEISTFRQQVEGEGFDAAYAAAVDRLLASPAFGEQMAVPWLDAARYADSHGYQSDQLNTQWPYRDWVVRAFNDNLPYDQFITWQLAGDLLPNATTDQRLATAFNRIHRMTNEGGSIREEWRLEYVADRVHTLGSAMLALTLECARCHDHKFDPISQRDYYALSAFFNSIDESGMYGDTEKVAPPTMQLPTAGQERELKEANEAIAAAEQVLTRHAATLRAKYDAWLAAERTSRATRQIDRQLLAWFSFDSPDHELTNQAPGADPNKRYNTAGSTVTGGVKGNGRELNGDDGIVFTKLFAPDWCDPFTIDISLYDELAQPLPCVVLHTTVGTDVSFNGFDLMIEGGHLEARLYREWPGNAIGLRTTSPIPPREWHRVTVTYDGSKSARGFTIYVDGQPAEVTILRDHVEARSARSGSRGDFLIGSRFRDRGFKQGRVDELRVFGAALTPLEISELVEPGSIDRALENPAAHADRLREYFVAIDAETSQLEARLQRARRQLIKLEEQIQTVSIMRELDQPQPAYVLARGAYDSPKTDENRVERDVLGTLLIPFPDEAPRNRLGLARWLTEPSHPLTSRVAVNRVWATFFGRGLVGTPENFGRQGERPTHPELLDWLARDFVASGWDLKRLCREIALSATFQQDSRLTPDLRERDSENRLLARGPSYRLSAEQIRDLALAASGLIDNRVGGPPVSPYQPGDDLWREANSMSPPYRQSTGKDVHRRSLYSVWKRTAPLPNMLAFDAPTREVCSLSRSRTNTPLQALVLLNDIQFIEAARALACEVTTRDASTPISHQIGEAYLRVVGRPPNDTECRLLEELYREQLDLFESGEQQAEPLLKLGESNSPEESDPNHLAAMTVVCQTLLNLDAAIYTR